MHLAIASSKGASEKLRARLDRSLKKAVKDLLKNAGVKAPGYSVVLTPDRSLMAMFDLGEMNYAEMRSLRQAVESCVQSIERETATSYDGKWLV